MLHEFCPLKRRCHSSVIPTNVQEGDLWDDKRLLCMSSTIVKDTYSFGWESLSARVRSQQL